MRTARLVFLTVLVFTLASCSSRVDNSNEDTTSYKDTPSFEDGIQQNNDNGSSNNDTTPVTGDWTISKLQKLEEGLNCAEGSDFINLYDDVELKNVVVASPLYSAANTLDGFFVSDGTGGPYSGVSVVFAKGMVAGLEVGDIVDIDGQVLEFYCNTQFKASNITKTGHRDEPLPATVVDLSTISSEGAGDTESYEGCLITIENVDVTEANTSYMSFTLGDKLYAQQYLYAFDLPSKGCRYKSITGILHYSYNYKFLPRSAADMVLDDSVACSTVEVPKSVYDVQNSEASLSCNGDGIDNVGGAEMENLVVTTPVIMIKESFAAYYAQDVQGGPFSGMYLLWDQQDYPQLSIGDVLSVKGEWKEYYCLTELVVSEFSKSGTQGQPDPEIVSAEALLSDDAEQWEGVLVTIQNAEIAEVDQYDNLLITTTAGNLVVDNELVPDFGLTAGKTLSSITGVVTYSYGEYKLIPRTPADLVQ